MKTNTVLLDLEKYDRLIEAYKKIKEPKKKTILIEYGILNRYECQTDDEATAKLAKELKETKEKLSEVEAKFKKMNFWQFLNLKQKKDLE